MDMISSFMLLSTVSRRISMMSSSDGADAETAAPFGLPNAWPGEATAAAGSVWEGILESHS